MIQSRARTCEPRPRISGSGAAAVFVNYTPSPEARYPTAINQAYAATKWVAEYGQEINVDGKRLAVVGNSVGGNMAAVVSLEIGRHDAGSRTTVLSERFE